MTNNNYKIVSLDDYKCNYICYQAEAKAKTKAKAEAKTKAKAEAEAKTKAKADVVAKAGSKL